MTFQNQVFFLLDYGLFYPLAEKLADSGAHVLYYPRWKSMFPKSKMAYIGTGHENIQVITNERKYIKEIDTAVFPDVGDRDLQEDFKSVGIPVWGAGKGEDLELERGQYRELATKLGIDLPKYYLINGSDNLLKFLKGKKDLWIKISRFRGDFETLHWVDEISTMDPLLDIIKDMGPVAKTIEFVVDEPINDALEPGYDGFNILGDYPDVAGWGYEIKDKVYVGKIGDYSKFPEPILSSNRKLAKALKALRYAGFISTEIRYKDKKANLMDVCARGGNPPLDAMLECYSNWPEIIYWGARGRVITPKATGKYVAMAIIGSEYSDKHWQTIQFPESEKRWYKFKNLITLEGKNYIVPVEQGLMEIGSVVAVENTLELAISKVKERAGKLIAHDIDVQVKYFEDAKEAVAEGNKQGFTF